MKNRQKKEPSVFHQEVRRDINTFRRLKGRKRLQFVWDYFRYKIIAAAFAVVAIVVIVNMLIQGQQSYRLRVCAVLNTEDDCQAWFDSFSEALSEDGNLTPCSLNQDQPFDYSNQYYYVMEMEVMTTVSSRKMDAAICGPDMYEYLLALNACMPLDTVLTEDELQDLDSRGMLVTSVANLQYKDDGTLDESSGIEGIYAVDISDTEFGKQYNSDQELDDGEEPAPLYAVIISNTANSDDAAALIKEISK